MVLSLEQEANNPEFKVIRQLTPPLCSLMIISCLYVSLLYIIIDQSSEPETNLLSFKVHKQFILFVWFCNIWAGFLFSIKYSSYKLLSFIILPKLLISSD